MLIESVKPIHMVFNPLTGKSQPEIASEPPLSIETKDTVTTNLDFPETLKYQKA